MFTKQLFIIFLFVLDMVNAKGQEWQWSVAVDSVVSAETKDHPRAFLWILPGCKQVRGVVVGQHNMLEEGILEHPAFRKSLSDIGFAEIWVTPGISLVFDFAQSAGERFTGMIDQLAVASGYTELRFAPVVPIGHSAAASYPWNFGAWNPARTLAMLSIHGDAPLTSLTGSGRPNPAWVNRSIDGIPGLIVMGEYEWWEDRLSPAFRYMNEHPKAPVSLLADAGRGHFDFSDALVNYLSLFIRKAATARLPRYISGDGPVPLKDVDPASGWLGDRWRQDSLPTAKAAPFPIYRGDRHKAFWYFDREMAVATEKYYATVRGKKPQYIGFLQSDSLLAFNSKLHARIIPQFQPLQDGVTFHLKAVYTDSLRTKLTADHGRQNIVISRVCGPVIKIDDTTFSVRFYRMGLNNSFRTPDIWLLAASDGDREYKSSVQQLNIKIPMINKSGVPQIINFPPLPDIRNNSKPVMLKASSDAGMQVYYYVMEGPALVIGNTLNFTQIPPNSKFPLKITVVAWQYGRSSAPQVQTAAPVFRTFYIHDAKNNY